jgi:hypothetical protein
MIYGMIFVFGILLGLIISILIIATTLYAKPMIDRTIKQFHSSQTPKGSIIEPEVDELSSWVESLKVIES